MPIRNRRGTPQFENDAERDCFNFFVREFLPNLMTAEALAKLLGVRRRTVVNWWRERGLQSFKIGGGRVFYVHTVREWAKRGGHTAFVETLERAMVSRSK